MRGDIVSGLVAVQMSGGGSVTVSDIHEVFKQQPVLFSILLLGDYRADIVKMPPEVMYTTTRQYTESTDSVTGERYFVETGNEKHSIYTHGIYKGDKYIGLTDLRAISIQSDHYQISSNQANKAFLQQRIEREMKHELREGDTSYSYNSQIIYVSDTRVTTRTTYDEAGTVTDRTRTEDNPELFFVRISNSSFLKYVAIDYDTYDSYLGEYMQMINNKYHEING